MFFQVNQASKLPHALAYQGQARVYSRCRLDTVERLSVSSQHITLFQAALLARCTRSNIGAWIRLQFVQLLGQFPQHTGAEIGAALGQESALAGQKHTCRQAYHTHMQRLLVLTHASG